MMPAWVTALLLLSPPPAERPVPVHRDGPAVEAGMLDAMRALMHGDGPGAQRALDRVEGACRRLEHDEAPAWPRAVVNEDRALHLTLDRARELAARGEVQEVVETMVWALRSCRTCHALRPTTSSPSDSGSPNPPSASTP